MTTGWRVEVTAPARRDLRRCDPPVRKRVRETLDRLVGEPAQGDVVRLRGRDEWRVRVGDWRVRVRLDTANQTVVVLRVLPRGRAYRD